MKQRVHNEELTAVLFAAGLMTEAATPTQILLLLLGQLETLRLQTLDHGFPQLGVLPRSDSKTWDTSLNDSQHLLGQFHNSI